MTPEIKPLTEQSDAELLQLFQQVSGRVGMYGAETLILRMFEISEALNARFAELRKQLSETKTEVAAVKQSVQWRTEALKDIGASRKAGWSLIADLKAQLAAANTALATERELLAAKSKDFADLCLLLKGETPPTFNAHVKAIAESAMLRVEMYESLHEMFSWNLVELLQKCQNGEATCILTAQIIEAEYQKLRDLLVKVTSAVWIPVADRTPTAADLPVLLWNAAGPKIKYSAMADSLRNQLGLTCFTHWMPAPAAPQTTQP